MAEAAEQGVTNDARKSAGPSLAYPSGSGVITFSQIGAGPGFLSNDDPGRTPRRELGEQYPRVRSYGFCRYIGML
jgi:hypothetical protein